MTSSRITYHYANYGMKVKIWEKIKITSHSRNTQITYPVEGSLEIKTFSAYLSLCEFTYKVQGWEKNYTKVNRPNQSCTAQADQAPPLGDTIFRDGTFYKHFITSK
jgi:hypothetical protein